MWKCIFRLEHVVCSVCLSFVTMLENPRKKKSKTSKRVSACVLRFTSSWTSNFTSEHCDCSWESLKECKGRMLHNAFDSCDVRAHAHRIPGVWYGNDVSIRETCHGINFYAMREPSVLLNDVKAHNTHPAVPLSRCVTDRPVVTPTAQNRGVCKAAFISRGSLCFILTAFK